MCLEIVSGKKKMIEHQIWEEDEDDEDLQTFEDHCVCVHLILLLFKLKNMYHYFSLKK